MLLALAAILVAQKTGPGALVPAPARSGVGAVAFPASGVELLGWVPVSDFPGANASANEVWGHTSASGREYALQGLSGGTAFVEVTDPGAPELVAFHPGPTHFWRTVRAYRDHAYAGSEGGGGLQVFDLSRIDSGSVTLAGVVLDGGFSAATHTLAVDPDSGFLYRAGGGPAQGLVIYDLADPAHPALAGEWHAQYVHEVQAVTWALPGPWLGRELVLCATGPGRTLVVLDATDKAAIATLATLTYPGARFTHQVWLAGDGRHLYLNDEFDDPFYGLGRTRVLDLADPTAPLLLGDFEAGVPTYDHNLYVAGDRLYASNFRGGLRVLDTSIPAAPVPVAWFDTYPDDDALEFNSLWTSYPFFASGTVLGSDIEKGLLVWRLGAPALRLALPDGAPELLDPAGDTVRFEVTETWPGALEPGSARLLVTGSAGTASLPTTPVGPGLFEARVPPLPCGTRVALAAAASSTDGVTWTHPPAAPTQAFPATAAYGVRVVAVDPLEVESGWTAGAPGDTATMGAWVRVDPVGTAAQPEDDRTDGSGTHCFVTGQGVPGAPAGDSDVDGGTTTLLSPAFDASGLADAHVSYWRWFSGHQTVTANDDAFRVDLSNDGGATWTALEVVGPGDPDALGGWIRHHARLADFLAPTAAMRLRFRAEDLGAGSIVEAAIDELVLYDLECASATLAGVTPPGGTLGGGELVTLTGTGFRAGTRVRFGPRAAEVVELVSSTVLRVRAPPAPRRAAGRLGELELRVDVTVEDPGTATLPGAYRYELPRR